MMRAISGPRLCRLSSELVVAGALVALSAAGCASSETRDDPAPTQPNTAEAAPAESEPAMPDDDVHRQAREGAAHGEGQPAAGEDGAVYTGVVQEAINAAGYTYLKVQLDDGAEQWAAVEEAPVTVGERVSIKISMRMTNFRSKGLDRTFSSIWFGYVEAAPAPASAYDDTI